MNIYVDMDGTLVSNALDNIFKEMVGAYGTEEAVKIYNGLYVDDLEINMPLVKKLVTMKKRGHKVIVWTNRGLSQKEMTMKNLSSVIDLFDDFVFCGGAKKAQRVNGVVIDNDTTYTTCGTHFIHTTF